MSVPYEALIHHPVDDGQPPFIPLTPIEERPFVAHVVRVACAEFAPYMLENVDYLEAMRRRFDNSGGSDSQAAIAIARVSGIIMHTIHVATSRETIRDAYGPTLPADIEQGMPSPYSLISPHEDLGRTTFKRQGVKPRRTNWREQQWQGYRKAPSSPQD